MRFTGECKKNLLFCFNRAISDKQLLIWYVPSSGISRLYGSFIPSFLRNFHTVPGGSDGDESSCNAGDLGLILGLGRSPGEGNGYPL